MRSSTNMYLCCLGFSDNSVLLTALFLFFLDSMKRYSLRLTIFFNMFSPYVYPAGMIAQTCSVYFTLVAAIDCFTHVCCKLIDLNGHIKATFQCQSDFDKYSTIPERSKSLFSR